MTESKRHIIVVESDPALRDAIATLLEVNGFTVHAIACGKDFLSAALPSAALCVIIGTQLDDMSGLDMLTAAKSRIAARFVLASSLPNGGFALRAQKLGAWKVLSLPFSGTEILKLVRSIAEEA